ncbi:hypothetical protein BCR35DRAFT_354923, partial [Leucosporidium creatinivorum]
MATPNDSSDDEQFTSTGPLTALSALHDLDSAWFTTLHPAFLDIVSYAGQERFVIDGDALISHVLDDQLLALGRKGDPSLQLLHATWKLEHTVQELQRRDCIFDVVFFDSQSYASVHAGADPYIVASRRLARAALQRRANLPGVKVYTFTSLLDDAWLDYYYHKRPMFIMGYDGGLPTEGADPKSLEAERILVQRQFIVAATAQKITFVLLQAAKYKDAKVMTYLYNPERYYLPASISLAGENALAALAAATPAAIEGAAPASSSLEDVLKSAASSFIASSTPSASTSALLYLFLSHALLLPTIPLSSRAQRISLPSTTLSTTLESFLTPFYASLTSSISALPLDNSVEQVDIDGRVFYLLLLEVLSSTEQNVADLLGPTVFTQVSALWTSLGQSPVDFTALKSSLGSDLTTTTLSPPLPTQSSTEATPSVLPFNNPTIDPYLTSVHVSSSPAPTTASIENVLEGQSNLGDEPYWENPKPVLPTHLGGPPPAALDARARKKRDRKEQRFMAAMQKSAASLTGAMGTSLKQQAIPAVGKRSVSVAKAAAKEEKRAPPPPRQQKEPKGGKALTSKEKLLAENAAKKQAEEGAQNHLWWTEKLALLKPLTPASQISQLTAYLKNRRASDRWLGTEMLLKRVDLELRRWIADERREEGEVADGYRVFVARTVGPLLVKAKKGGATINERQGRALVATLEALGLGCLIPEGIVFGKEAEAEKEAAETKGAKGGKGKKDDKKSGGKKEKDGKKSKDEEKEDKGAKLSFSFLSFKKGDYGFMKIAEDPLEWQLRCMGEFMARELDSRPDPRVNFDPDAWQREVLDKIDADESMLIIAPTSSGKTFISFAAMERVLRESDDGVVVYVAPSKALVNQVAAEAFARFSKEVAGQSLWAIHTGDYKINNPQNCQILVTVPHVLSEMLLNPALARVWTPRIRRIIVDEIHAIAEEGGGLWEQVLLMNPAPIIGLSATVGDPERFSNWLGSVEESCGRKYSLVQHHHRFNALRKFAYAPAFPVKPIGSLNEHKPRAGAFAPVHPIAALALGDPNLPSDLALEPRDCLSLWQAMNSVSKLDEALTPNVYFAKTPAIAIRDVIGYEKELKKVLVEWREAPDSNEESSPFQKVVKALEAPLRQALEEPEKEIEEGTDDDFNGLFLPLLADLNAQGNLPAIIFNFSRDKVEALGKRILEDLEAAETRWRASSPAYKLKLQKAKEDEKLAAKKAKAAESASRNKKDDDDDRGAAEEEGANLFNPDDPSEEFSFVGRGLSQVEFKKEVDDLAWLGLSPWLMSALRRGVGVHHSGMNRRYRVLVENLYRRGVLRVVISTETLALGINAPARTAVFGGDSVALNALNFRQCAGRAGRRGFDTLGNVLFVGIRLDRIERLLLSKLPKLAGTFPLTTTLVLRLQNLLWGSDSAPLPAQNIETLLTIPQLSVSDSSERALVRHFVRFSVEYLRRMGLIDETGRPMNLFGTVSALYPEEPSNFALVALYRSGELHKLVENLDADPQATLQALLTVLASLFGTVHRRKQNRSTLRAAARNSSSLMVLPPLPEGIARALTRHEEAITSIFSAYAKEYAQQHSTELGVDDKLPVSGRKVAVAESADSAFASKLRQSEIAVESRSLFVASSGHGDLYQNPKELVDTSRQGVAIQQQAIPSLTSPILGSDEHQLDAFVVDFFKHGSLDVLVRDNGISRSRVWYFLQDFDKALVAVKAAIETLLQRSGEERDDDNDSDDGNDRRGGGDDDDKPKENEIERPAGVSDADWRLYSAISELQAEFSDRFRAIYA